MPALVEDDWINQQAQPHPVSDLEDCAIAIDATYYLQSCLDHEPHHEPLVVALAGLTSIQSSIETDLDQFHAHRITPFFIFDGQAITGQDDISTARGRQANYGTDEAWEKYFNGEPGQAVRTFGENSGAFRVQRLYPLLQSILRRRQLHFLVPPYNAAAQLAHFEMVNSDQVAGVMGSQELMVYPINDCVMRSFDWGTKTVSAISKKGILKTLNIPETLFIDAFLMTGTSFLPPFPPLSDSNIIKSQPFTINDAVNILRTADKSVAQACNSFSDILKVQDPDWLDKFRKARMAVNHFIYVSEKGEVKVHDFDRLTSDNHEYLGLQLPSELFHYLNTGLIGPRVLSWITHGQVQILPTLDGTASPEYKQLVSTQLVPVKEAALGVLIPRLNRGIVYKKITMKVWYDRNFSYTIWDRHETRPALARKVGSWTIKEAALKEHFPQFAHGSIASEVLSLKNADFAKSTVAGTEKGTEKVRGLVSSDQIASIVIWRFLHLRGYIDDSHQLTPWGSALAVALKAFEPTVQGNPEVPHLYESLLVAFELLRFDLLNTKNEHRVEFLSEAIRGSETDQASLFLITRCATLLKLRHQQVGYTGPLSKNLLVYHSLVSEVRNADRDLIEAILASLFLHAQAKRQRDDSWELSHRLPFLFEPELTLAIAVKTWLNELTASEVTPVDKEEKKKNFPGQYMPHATHLWEDVEICYSFFDAVHAGIKALDAKELSASDRTSWDKAAEFLQKRR